MLVGLGVECPQPAGGFYLYPDFAPWRAELQQHGITTGEQLARFLLDEWDIATLPGKAFGDRPDALRLRLATSMLYSPEGAQSREERDKLMWEMLAQARSWANKDESGQGAKLELPMLERAQKRFGEFISSLR
jgi:aspartate/methionine/tyrosine aminotransferase